MSNYTPEMVQALTSQPTWTHAEAVAFANEHGLKPRSVIAKIVNLGLPYQKKPEKVTKRGEPVIQKAQYVEAIQAVIGVTVGSLVKLTKSDLETLAEAVNAEMPEARQK